MESFKDRLIRFIEDDPCNTFGWAILMTQNTHATELRQALSSNLYFSVYLLAHAIIQTVSETMFDKRGLAGTQFFLKRFVDVGSGGPKFGEITEELHEVRNVLAHRGYSRVQHHIEYLAYDIESNWVRSHDRLLINPCRYGAQIERVTRPSAIMPAFKQLSPLTRLQRKYDFIQRWLGLEQGDALNSEIRKLCNLPSETECNSQAVVINAEIRRRYQL